MINKNEFDRWSQQKQQIESKNKVIFARERDVFMSTLGKNIGSEENGSGNNFSRPVLIIKMINRNTILVVPLTTKQKNLSYYHNFSDSEGNEVSVIFGQIRLISTKRLKRKMYKMDPYNFYLIKEKIIRFIK